MDYVGPEPNVASAAYYQYGAASGVSISGDGSAAFLGINDHFQIINVKKPYPNGIHTLTDSTSFSSTTDTAKIEVLERPENKPPTAQSAETSTAGDKVFLTYHKALSSTPAPTSAFAVTIDGNDDTVTAVNINGSTVELTLTGTVKNDQTVTVSYTDPTLENDDNAIQDSEGNDAESLSSSPVTNNSTVVGTAPTFLSAATNTDGTKVVLTYNEALKSTKAFPSPFPQIPFTVKTGVGTSSVITKTIYNSTISGSTVELSVSPYINNGEIITVESNASPVIPSAQIQDIAGNISATLSSTSVTNNSTLDGTAPTFSSAATNTAGTKVILTYNEALSSTTARASEFTVTTNGATNTVTAVAVVGSTVELTLNDTVENDQTVTVAYTDPTPQNDQEAVQDTARNGAVGNDAASLTTTAVTNNSTVVSPSPEPTPAPSPNPEPTPAPEPEPTPSNELPADVSAFNAEDIATLTLPEVSELSADQLSDLAPAAIEGFTSVQVAELSTDTVAAFTTRQINQLSADAVSALSKAQVTELSTKAVRGFSADHVEQLPMRSFKALESVQLAKLSKDAVTGLTSSQLKTLSGDELAALRPGRVKSISPKSISGLKASALDDLSKRQIKVLTTEQLAGLTKKQIKRADDFFDALSNQQREALSFDPGRSNRLVDPFDAVNGIEVIAGQDPLA